MTSVQFTDYYSVLGVARDADQAAVKAAFRRQARKLHPDVNKDPSAEERFKQLNEAYEVLKDPEKRAKYDRLGANWEELSRQEDLFRTRQGAARAPAAGAGGAQYSDFFETFFGGGHDPFADFEEVVRTDRGRTTFRFRRGQDVPIPPRRGVDVEEDVDISLEEAARGGVRMLSVNERQVEVRIPPGVAEGSRVRVGGEGGEGTGGAGRGDVYLRVRLRPHPTFTVRGRDLTADVPVRDDQAVLGDTVKVDGILGPLQVRVPAGTQAGRVLRLRGKGLPGIRGAAGGDLLLTVRVTVPQEPSEEERGLYERLRAMRAGEATG